jgi:hypothetical protein
VRGGNFIEPRHGDVFNFDFAALGREVVHPAVALQSQVDGEEVVFEATGEREEPVVLGRTESEMHALAFGCVFLPVIEAEFALELERLVEASRGAGRPALVEPLLGRPVGIKRHSVSCIDEGVSRKEPGLARADNGDAAHRISSSSRRYGR